MQNKQNMKKQQIESFEPMILMSASGADIDGTDGDDVLIAFHTNQEVDGLDGDDVLIGLGGSNVLRGGDGNDRFITVSGMNVIDGGNGQDTLQFLNKDRSEFTVVDRGFGIIELSNDQQKNFITNVEAVQFLDALYTIDALLGTDGGGQGNAPVIVDPASAHISISENTSFVVDVNATDLDGDSLAYSITDGDSALFTIDPQTGELSFVNPPDFENPGDSDGDNTYDVTVVVSDGTNTVSTQLWITVIDVDENGGDSNTAPEFTNVQQNEVVEVAEGTTFVGDADASDADGDTLTYSISGGADADRFSINAQTGKVVFNTAPDFENPGDADGNNKYQLRLRVSDGQAFQDRDVTIWVTDVNDGNSNGAPFFTNVHQNEVVEVAEGTTFVGDADASDPDSDTLTYSISGGVDADRFSINAQTGKVVFNTAPDFENPGDEDGNNKYQLRLRVSDGQAFQDRNVTIWVTDVNDGSTNSTPFFTNVQQNEVVEVAEGTTFVGDADATDPDGDTLTYSISGGVDADRFSINAQTGKVVFNTAPDFENPGDADGNNKYQLRLRVSDGQAFQDRDVTIWVTDVNDGNTNGAPTFTNVHQNESVVVSEGTTFVGDADASDPDGDTLTYSISGGVDAGQFTINSATGVLSFQSAPDFEYPTDVNGDNFYEVRLRVSDGHAFQDRDVFVQVDDVNEGTNQVPRFSNVQVGDFVNVKENTTFVGNADALDADGDAFQFSISGGPDASLFSINAHTGVLKFIDAPDFENPADSDGDNSYGIIIRVSDGVAFQDRLVWIEVIDTAG